MGGEEAAIEGLLDLSNLSNITPRPTTAEGQWQTHTSPQQSSHPDQNFSFLPSSEIAKTPQSITGSISTALHLHSPVHQFPTPSRRPNIQLTGQETILLRNYIDNISPWVLYSFIPSWISKTNIPSKIDTGDPLNHFGTTVPQRAMQHPILLYAIFAISAQNLSRVAEYDEREDSRYYSECISLLIPVISVDEDCDENVLAATVLLRIYEEGCGTSHFLFLDGEILGN